MKAQLCIFCLENKTIEEFSEEHIFPFSSGNDSLVLKNMVCGDCNNGALSEIDNVLLEHYPLKIVRALGGINNRKGSTIKYVSTDQHEILREGNTVHISLPCNKKGPHKHDRSTDEMQISMRVNRLSNKKSTMLARALCKILFESIAYNKGQDFVLQGGFNGLRDFIIKGKPTHGGCIAYKHAQHGKQCFAASISEKGENTIMIHTIQYYVGMFDDDFTDKTNLKEAVLREGYRVALWDSVL